MNFVQLAITIENLIRTILSQIENLNISAKSKTIYVICAVKLKNHFK